MAELTKEEKAELWRQDHEAEMARRAEAKREEREDRRSRNRQAWNEHQQEQLAEQFAAREERQRDRQSRREGYSARTTTPDPRTDAHNIEMARTFRRDDGGIGIPVEDFLRWQADRRREMATPQSQDEVDRIMKEASR